MPGYINSIWWNVNKIIDKIVKQISVKLAFKSRLDEEKTLGIIEERYNPSSWNLYAFHGSDGENWLEDNEVLFSYADWFMTDKDIQASGKVSPSGKCYDWVSESLSKQSDW